MQRSDTKSHAALRDEILADSQRQAKRLTAKAEREAQAMVDKATVESQEEQQVKLAEARASAARIRTLMLATLPVEIGRTRSVRVEQELLKLRERAGQELHKRKGFAYDQTLASLAAEALTHMAGETFVLVLSAQDLSEHAQNLPAAAVKQAGRPDIAVTVSSEPAEITGGVIIRDPAGRQVWDNSLEARLDRMWPQLRNQLAEKLELVKDLTDSGGPS